MFERLMARVYDRVLAGAERGRLGSLRARLLADVAGDVLVLGAGTGADLPHLGERVSSVVLVEPSAPMRRQLADAVPPRLAGVTRVVDAVGERLPLADDSVDHVLVSLVLCSVEDPDAVVAELDRVLRPGGDLRVVEHGAADGVAGVAQRVVDPVWQVVVPGCHLRRDPRAVLASRFDVGGLEPVAVPPISRLGVVTAGTVGR